MAYADRHIASTVSTDINGIAVTSLFAFANRGLVHKVAVRVNGTDASGASGIVFARRRAASTDTTIATVVLPVSNNNGITFYKLPTAPVEMLPGDEIIVTVTEAGGALLVNFIFEYSINDEENTAVGANFVLST